MFVATMKSLQGVEEGFVNPYMDEAELPETLIGDHIRLRQVLINLIKNAFKFTRMGLIRVLIAYDSVDEIMKVSIIDSGKGIKPEEKD